MPTIAYFLGIMVAMYHRDHNPPHIHVFYQGYEALITIEDARVLRGQAAANGDAGYEAMDHVEARSAAR